jgi:CDP-diacylglycerol--glycerol-3-phosphate 3-phosphatidyltransferase
MSSTPSQAAPPERVPQEPPPIESGALNVPNLITLSRIVLSLVLFTVINIEGYWLTAVVLFALAASTDALDGYIARKYGLVTALGRILDPFADKLVIGGSYIFLVNRQAVYGSVTYVSGVTAWMAVIVIGREMFVTSLRGYLEKQGRDFSATWSGKIKMIVQCAAVPVSLLALSDKTYTVVDPHAFAVFRDCLLWFTVLITLYSGVTYTQRAIAMLRESGTGR